MWRWSEQGMAVDGGTEMRAVVTEAGEEDDGEGGGVMVMGA